MSATPATCYACGSPVAAHHGWAGADHRARYAAAVDAYARARGMPPDRYWRAFLRLTTALPGLWERIAPGLDFGAGAVRVPRGLARVLSSGERALLEVALSLYRGTGAVDLAGALDRLDDVRAGVLLATLADFHGHPRAAARAAG